MKLDSEGGAEATTPKTRYLATAVSLTLGAASVSGDRDVDNGVAHTRASTGAQVAGGASGFKLVGTALGLAVHSRALGYTMGAYGAGMSVYSHFIARGREVVFPKNTAMEIGIGRRQDGAARNCTRLLPIPDAVHQAAPFEWESGESVPFPDCQSHFVADSCRRQVLTLNPGRECNR